MVEPTLFQKVKAYDIFLVAFKSSILVVAIKERTLVALQKIKVPYKNPIKAISLSGEYLAPIADSDENAVVFRMNYIEKDVTEKKNVRSIVNQMLMKTAPDM